MAPYHPVLAYLQVYLSSCGVVEIESLSASALQRVEVHAHAVRVGLRSVPPVEFYPYGDGVRVVVTQFLVLARREDEGHCSYIKKIIEPFHFSTSFYFLL